MKKGIVGIIVLAFLVLIVGAVGKQRHSGNTSVGLLTKQDSIEIEQLTGRKIIGEIDTTEFFHYGESMWHYLKQERDFVKRNVDLAFDYNLSEYYSVIHFFYDEELNCHYDCH